MIYRIQWGLQKEYLNYLDQLKNLINVHIRYQFQNL